MTWRLLYTKAAQKDARILSAAGLKEGAQSLLDILAEDPFWTPPPLAKLIGDLSGAYSRRIYIQHRLGYQVVPQKRVVSPVHGGADDAHPRRHVGAMCPAPWAHMAPTSGRPWAAHALG